MKTQLSKPARSRASYTEECKKQALELWRNSGRSATKVAAELGNRVAGFQNSKFRCPAPPKHVPVQP